MINIAFNGLSKGKKCFEAKKKDRAKTYEAQTGLNSSQDEKNYVLIYDKEQKNKFVTSFMNYEKNSQKKSKKRKK